MKVRLHNETEDNGEELISLNVQVNLVMNLLTL